MSDSIPQTKAELLTRIQRGWEALQATLGQLSDAQLTTRGPEGGWSVKDHLAHLAVWGRGTLASLEGRPRHLALGVDEATYQSDDEARINAIIEAQNRDRPLADVLIDLRETHRQMLAALEARPFADLLQEEDGASILVRVIGNTYEHYEEHIPWIEALFKLGH